MSAQPPVNPVKHLFNRLRPLGLTQPYIRRTILPDWWNDEAASTPAGYGELLRILARHLGLDLPSLRAPEGPVLVRQGASIKLKTRADAPPSETALTQAIAVQVARAVAAATNVPYLPLPVDPASIRDEILAGGAPWVGFSELVDYCWSRGVPVVHVAGFPKNSKKMEGLVTQVDGRPVIVLTSNKRKAAWQLFTLAHEVGHLGLGHVAEGGVVVDQTIDPESRDVEEVAANRYAIHLLTGSAETHYRASSRWPNADDLARAALQLGTQNLTDPGHIVLNYAYSMGGQFPVANLALETLDPRSDALVLLRDRLNRHTDWSLLPADTSAWLVAMTGPLCAE